MAIVYVHVYVCMLMYFQAELAAEEERANVNELLFMLKDKERESTQLR